MEKDFLNMAQTIALLGVTRQSIYYMIRTGQLKRYRKRGRVYFLRSDVEKLMIPQEA